MTESRSADYRSADHRSADRRSAVGVTVNGEHRTFDAGTTVREMLALLGLPEKGVAVAVDGVVFAKSQWDTDLGRGWTVDVLTAVQGG